MCSPARCHACAKTTWTGCGQHADMVMARVPADQRCECRSQAQAPATNTLSGFSVRR